MKNKDDGPTWPQLILMAIGSVLLCHLVFVVFAVLFPEHGPYLGPRN